MQSPTLVGADQLSPAPDITLKQLRMVDVKATGARPSIDVWFPGYGDYEVEDGNYLFLDYNHSELVRPYDSTMTVSVNGVPVATTLLGAESTKRAGLKVPIPKERLQRDLNHVQVQFSLNMLGVDCVSTDPGLWAMIYDATYVHYQYTTPLKSLALPEPDLARFPEPFLRATITEGVMTFVVPDGATASDFSATASVAARFGQASGGKPITTTLRFASQVNQANLSKSDLVVIGRAGANPLFQQLSPSLPLKIGQGGGQAVFLDGAGSPIDPNMGVIQEIRSPWDARFTVLVISGGNDEGVLRAVRTLSSRIGMRLLQGSYAVISPTSEELKRFGGPEITADSATISFEQIGVGEQRVSSLGSHAVTFSLDAPPANLQEEAYLDLVMSYSTVIDPIASTITVSLNGTPIRSFQMKSEDAQKASHRITLPQGSLRPGLNDLAIATNMYAQNSLWWCAPPADERGWAVFHAESAFVLPIGSDPVMLDLANLPYPFVRNGIPSGTFLVIPSDGVLTESSLQVAVALGRMSLGGSTEMRAGQSAQIPQDAKSAYDFILFGTPENNQTLDDISPRLPLSLQGGAQRLLQRPELALLGVADSANLGVLELVPSPQNVNRAVLAVTGTSEKSVAGTPQSLSTKLPRGSAAVIARDETGDPVVRSLGIAGAVQTVAPETTIRRRFLTLLAAPVLVLIVLAMGFMLVRAVRR